MWRAGVLLKRRRLWSPFVLQVYGFPTVQSHSSRSFNTSQIMPTHSFISWQQSTGSKVREDGAFLFKQSLQVRIHDALHLGDTKMAINLLSHLGSIEDSFSSEDCMFLLEYCWRFPDPEFALELWRIMDERKLNIKRNVYLYILRSLTKGGYLDEALYLLKLFGEHGCKKPGLDMCDIFLNGCSKYNSLVHATSCLELMEKNCIGKSELTYIELMKLAVHRHNISILKQVWEEYNMFFPPSILSFQALIQSLCRMRDSAEANEALQRMILVVLKRRSIPQPSQNSQVQALKVRIPVPFKAFNEPGIEVLSEKYGTRGLREADGPHISQMDVLSVPPSKFRDPVTSSEWDNLKQSQNLKIDFGDQLLHDCLNENNIESQLLNESRKRVLQTSNDTTATGLSCNGKIFYSKHPSSTLSGMNKHSTACGRYKMEVDIEGGNLKQISCLPALCLLRKSFNDVIYLAAFTRNYNLAERLFLQMHMIGLKPLRGTYNAFLKAVVLTRGVIQGMKVVRVMKNKKVKPNSFTYATLAVGYSKNQQLDLAEEMLEKMIAKGRQYIYPFNSLLAACCKADEPERAVRVLARMKLVKMKPNLSTYELIFCLFGNVNAPYERGDQPSQEAVSKRIATIEMDMVRNGVKHSQTSMRNLLKAFGAEGMMKEVVRYFHVAEDLFNGRDVPLPGTSIYNVVLHALVHAKEWEMAIGIFERMKSFGIKPNAETYTIMIDCCTLNRDIDSARGLMTTMLQHGFKHHARTYTSIVKIMLANDEFEKVLNFLEEMKEEGIRLDVIVYNTILRQASEKVRFDVIELLIEHMHRQKIKPDPEICLQVFSSYYEHGFIDTALEALQVLSVRMMSENETVQRNMKSTYEELVLDEGPDVEESLVEIFKNSREYLSASLFNMRLCALTGVSNSWLPDESPWAIRLSLQYNQSLFVGQQ